MIEEGSSGSTARYDAIADHYDGVIGDDLRDPAAVALLGIEYVDADATTPGVLDALRFRVITCHFGLSDIDRSAGSYDGEPPPARSANFA
jgi:hypothetical protein